MNENNNRTSEELIHGKTKEQLDDFMQLAMVESVRAIKKEMQNLVIQDKHNEHKEFDLVTSADYSAQKKLVELIEEHYPEAGMIGEESELRTECKNKEQDLIFVFDPLDGTKQFSRGGQHSVASQIGVVLNNKIISTVIKNVMSGDTVSLRVQDGKVVRTLEEYDYEGKLNSIINKELTFSPAKRIKGLMAFEDPYSAKHFPTKITDIVNPETGYFKSLFIATGSFGTNAMDVALNIRSGMLTARQFTNPWDVIPVIGILEALGYISLQFDQSTNSWSPISKTWSFDKMIQEITVLVHKDEAQEFTTWFQVQ